MEPSFYNDDLILIDHAQTRPADGLIYAVRFSHDLYVKRVQSLPGDRLQLLSTNAFYPPIIIDPDASTDFQVIGRVVASMHEW